MSMLKSSLVLIKLNSIYAGFTSNYYLEYWHFFFKWPKWWFQVMGNLFWRYLSRSQNNHYCCLPPTSSFCNCIGDIIASAIAPCAVDHWFENRSGKVKTIELSLLLLGYVRSIKEEEETLVLISNYNSEVTFYNKQAKNKSWNTIKIKLSYAEFHIV